MRHRIILAPLVVTLSALSATADTNKAIARCSAIDGDLKRLDCFDTLSKELGLDRPQRQPVSTEGLGKWIVDKKVNPIDDSTTVTMMLAAESGASRWGTPVMLIIRCQSDKTELFISWNDYLGSEAEVLTRVGSAKARTRRWGLSTDRKASFYPGNPVSFIKELLAADRVVAQVTPYGESPVTAIFSIAGIEGAVAPVRETCGW